MTTGSIPSDAPGVAPTSRAEAPTSGPAMLDHEYDGIKEYDNPLPGWWVKVFWGTFFFSIGYAFHYHVSGNGTSVEAAYESEMAVVRAERARRALGEKVSEDGLSKLMGDAKLMADAKAIFAQRCLPCHGERGQGVIGPNLTDAHWLHGKGTLMDIHQVVSEGIPAKGMPAWNLQLSPIQVRELAALVGSFRGTNLPGKAPEGTLVETPAP
jgi:cytochrome c oxidase cbb3-type subunit III